MGGFAAMTADLVVSGGRVGGAVRDVVVADGGIVAVTEPGQSGPSTRVIDADGVVVMAGAVDAHVHFDEPGRTEWEGWAAGSLAAAAGGVTTVVDMPIDSDPPTIDADAVAAKRAAATSSSLVDFALWGGLVPGNAGALEALLDAGVVGLKAFLCDSGWTDFPPCTGDALDSGMRGPRPPRSGGGALRGPLVLRPGRAAAAPLGGRRGRPCRSRGCSARRRVARRALFIGRCRARGGPLAPDDRGDLSALPGSHRGGRRAHRK